ncbi:hypothetical protein CQS04_07230 [Chryseomicrobium excrementi]|uniref:Uncharacterized protein n=1 Tax=Chryseomicrobium excrementi TaxID=2041346 RepID=A0A2M9F0F7_9BACL|nr:hypothetical protein [Chryseomicrobium excrementi]PJK16939.1 hypothetical protein CQS04_07230 [Chryseomicrobium excrementi]
MKKQLSVLLFLIFSIMLSGCMPDKTLTKEQLQGLNDPIAGFLMEVDDEFINIDITEPYVEYAEANGLGYEDFAKDVRIKRIGTFEIVTIDGLSLDVEDLECGTTIYFDYNFEDYGPDTIEIEREKLVVE